MPTCDLQLAQFGLWDNQVGNTAIVQEIMRDFAVRTGLSDETVTPRRYLWTDAFAVCNYLELFRQTGDEAYRQDALHLVGQVHQILGKHRADDRRRGWISGLDEARGQRHPTRGGLRIGKAMNERGADEAFDERLEWERDGQYFHYLTKWMHALDRVARVTGSADHARWALELAKSVHAAFIYSPSAGRGKRMVWKMSIDLSRPLVASMGQHDPLDGLITYEQLRATAATFAGIPAGLDLDTEIADMRDICRGLDWATHDSLGIGGLLADACRLTQLIIDAGLNEADRLDTVLADAEIGLETFSRRTRLDDSADYRLAFRELGLSIGLHSFVRMREMIEQHPEAFPNPQALESRLPRLARFLPLAEVIEGSWLDSRNRHSSSWRAHLDINSVMLGTSLAPDGYCMLR